MSFNAFDGRVIAITGVGRVGQVGEAIARAFAERGATLALLDYDAASVKARAEELGKTGARAQAFPCDLSDPAAAERAAADVRTALSAELDALVNVAGGFAMSGPLAESDPTILDRQIAINVKTAYYATRAFLPMLRARRGAIIFFGSAAVLPTGKSARMSAYAVAKSGVLALMRTIAEEEQATGVRANALAPTSIRTGDNLASMGEKVRYVEREDVADAVVFLCSDAARAITGQVVRLG
jgi:NAD(P)-dependent dehydrogenase (short-subunit alcohol dehydrogenase family)